MIKLSCDNTAFVHILFGFTGGLLMKHKHSILRRCLALVLVLALGAGIFLMIPSKAADTSDLGKLIDTFTPNDYTFTLSASSRIFVENKPADELLQTIQLSQRQFAADGIPTSTPMDIVWGDISRIQAGDILINLVASDADLGTEGYKLEVKSYATVTAIDVGGLLYGLNALQKHFRNAKSNKIQGFTAIDNPDTRERTVHLDCARKYLTKDWICNFVKEMSWMGYNSLELHFSEDGGFRADFWDENYYVKGEYEPKNDFSWLCGSYVQTWVHDATTQTDYNAYKKNWRNDPDKDAYLTTAELVEICKTCAEYHIDIIPSFDSPAHMDYITYKFQQQANKNLNNSYILYYGFSPMPDNYNGGCINYTGTSGLTAPKWPDSSTFNLQDGYMRSFIKTLYADIADFFSYYAGSTKFNIGADEVNLSYSKTWQYSEFPSYVNQLNSLLKAKGYTVRMFNDFIKSDYLDKFDKDIEILYWDSPTGNSSGAELTVQDFVNDGRTLYNAINTSTYYVLRISTGSGTAKGDARSEKCRQWTFYHGDETHIYNEWYSAGIREYGDTSETKSAVPDVPDSQLGGGYFLIWNDYASVNTEIEMWNGVYDFANNTGEFYSLRERMWSNITKMLNSDINSSLSFASYEAIRDTLGDFPGLASDTYSGTTKATTLPAATEPYHIAHDDLKEAIAEKIPQGEYSSDSYNVYLAAYNNAVAVNNDRSATKEQIQNALNTLNAAINQLSYPAYEVKVTCKAMVDGNEITLGTKTHTIKTTAYKIEIPTYSGYALQNVDGSDYTSAGFLTGSSSKDLSITVWYVSTISTGQMDALLQEPETKQEVTTNVFYTEESWNAYQTALNNAKNYSISSGSSQSDVDALTAALQEAQNALVTPSKDNWMTIEKLSEVYPEGFQVGLRIETSPNVSSVTIRDASETNTELTVTSGKVQVLSSGKVVKYWIVFFPADLSGSFTYDITANYAGGSITETLDITVG